MTILEKEVISKFNPNHWVNLDYYLIKTLYDFDTLYTLYSGGVSIFTGNSEGLKFMLDYKIKNGYSIDRFTRIGDRVYISLKDILKTS